MADYTYTKTGNIYVHKQGNDASYPLSRNDDITPATLASKALQCVDKALLNFVPKKTVQAGINVCGYAGTVLVKSGDYKETITQDNQLLLVGDGLVILRGDGTNTLTSASGTLSVAFVRDYKKVYVSQLARGVEFNCPVENGYGTSYTQCVFQNTTLSNPNTYPCSATYCTFVNCTGGVFNVLTFCDFGDGCDVAFSLQYANFGYNNIRGTVAVLNQDGNGSTGQGSTANKQLSFAQHRAEYPAYNINSFAAPAQFNSVARLNFTYNVNSPNFFGSMANSIGGRPVARSFVATDVLDSVGQTNALAQVNGATYTNMQQSGTDWVRIDTTQVGSMQTAPIFINSSPQPLGEMQLDGLKTFDESPGGVYVEVCRVRRADGTLAPGLSYWLRWTLSPTMPTTAAMWDNGAMTTASRKVAMLVGVMPQIDAAGRGNAEAGFDSTTASRIGCCWCEVTWEITSDRV